MGLVISESMDDVSKCARALSVLQVLLMHKLPVDGHVKLGLGSWNSRTIRQVIWADAGQSVLVQMLVISQHKLGRKVSPSTLTCAAWQLSNIVLTKLNIYSILKIHLFIGYVPKKADM